MRTTNHEHQNNNDHSGQTLILYYSNSGTTAAAARRIQQQTGGDLIAWQVAPAYPIDYSQLTEFSKQQIDSQALPRLLDQPALTNYQTIFIGFPTWYHQPPMLVNSFFASNDLRGKTIVPFTTSMNSPMSENTPFLTKMAQDSDAILQPGFRANDVKATTAYLREHGLSK